VVSKLMEQHLSFRGKEPPSFRKRAFPSLRAPLEGLLLLLGKEETESLRRGGIIGRHIFQSLAPRGSGGLHLGFTKTGGSVGIERGIEKGAPEDATHGYA